MFIFNMNEMASHRILIVQRLSMLNIKEDTPTK